MFASNSGYDRGVSTFSPEGRLFQVEYAIKAVQLGSTAIGIKTSEGIVLAVEKRVTSVLMEASSVDTLIYEWMLNSNFSNETGGESNGN
mmetsp:Transcript_8553/g.11147  ORF Transcript_8553/g.11147 Transcript_8553/m.11147 type:complete len:89 (+) Transcript_8553:15-281(+)